MGTDAIELPDEPGATGVVTVQKPSSSSSSSWDRTAETLLVGNEESHEVSLRLSNGLRFLAGLRDKVSQARAGMLARQREEAMEAALAEMRDAAAKRKSAAVVEPSTDEAPAGGGRRVPLHEALQVLLGKKQDI
jgi:uncharacterized protein YbjQ (UPF0145 family)